MTPDLLKIPLAIQIALAGGYLAYLVAYAGIRQHHNATDAAFRSLVFSLATSAILVSKPFIPYVNEAVAIAAALVLGIVWRWLGMRGAQGALRWTRISWSDDVPSAWVTITALRTDARPSQIAVDVDGGRVLLCEDTRRFEGAPFAPCVYGLDGSIALYVTAEMRPDGTWDEKTDVRHPIDGDKLTYIPASAVKRVEIRYWTKANEKAGKAAAQAVGVEAQAVAEGEPNPEYKDVRP